MEDKFFDIRPYNDSEFQGVLDQLLAQKELVEMIDGTFGKEFLERLRRERFGFKTIDDFIRGTSYSLLDVLLEKKRSKITFSGQENLREAAVYLSNHRDIISDPAFLQYCMVKNGFPTTEIGIGSNLAAAPWILALMKINKSFVVKRNLPRAEEMKALVELSEYINYTVRQRGASVWLAHREGRAKDSDDRTQHSLLKMLALKGEGSLLENLKALNICPISISYEYDPCDYLKAKEFQQRRDDKEFRKTKADDVLSMQTGLMGFVGEVHYHITPDINTEIDKIAERSLPRQQQVEQVADVIDRRIHSAYKIFKTNYIAFDLFYKENRFEKHYNSEEKAIFAAYVDSQVEKIDLPNLDREFCRDRILQNYSNTLVNYINVNQ